MSLINQKIAQYPLVMPLPAFLAGIILMEYFPLSSGVIIPISALVFFSGLVGYFLFRRIWFFFIIIPFLVSIGLILITEKLTDSNHISLYSSEDRDTSVGLTGVIVTPPQISPNRVRFTLEAKKLLPLEIPGNSQTSPAKRGRKPVKPEEGREIRVSGKVIVSIYHEEIPMGFSYGDWITLKDIWLRAPSGFKNPGNFDYAKYLRRQGIKVVTSLSRLEKLSLSKRATGFNFQKSILNLRERLLKTLDTNFPSNEAQLIKAIILRERLPPHSDLQKAFNNSGLAHLLSVSGLHVGFIAFLFYFLFHRALRFVRFNSLLPSLVNWHFIPSRLASLLCIIPIVFYTYLTEASLPTIRSAIMASTYMIARFLGRDKNYYNVLAMAAWAILLWNPQALFHVGFQLSFLAVGLLIWANEYRRIAKKEDQLQQPGAGFWRPGRLWLFLKERAPQYIWFASVASYGTMPLVGYYFNRVNPWAPLANMVTVPIGSLLVMWGTISLMISFISSKLAFLGFFLLDILAKVTYFLAVFFSSIPLASIPIPTPPVISIMALFPLFACFLYLKRNRKLLPVGLIFLLLFLFPLAWKYISIKSFTKLSVTFLDVGQGDASYIRLPNGQNMMIDSGGSREGTFDIGELVLLPFLRYNWVSGINLVANSHAHPDHIRGFFTLLNQMKVGRLWLSQESMKMPLGTDLYTLASNKPTVREIVTSGKRYETAGVVVEVLYPPENFSASGKTRENEENNSSLVIRVSYGAVSFLFTGDIEKEGEKALLPLGEKLQSTVLKVPHHGSISSSSMAFLKMVSPRAGVVQVSRTNPYSHPHPRILQRYAEMGVEIYRTDISGAVTMVTDGKELVISTFHQGE